MPSRVARCVAKAPNLEVWEALGEGLPEPDPDRPRDPYWEQGCHPDIVERVWDELEAEPAHRWGSGRVTDLAAEVGPGWIWGGWCAGESRWITNAYAAAAQL